MFLKYLSGILISCFCPLTLLPAQQVPDLNFTVAVETPRYASDQGPLVGIDGGHNNLHQLDGGFAPFAKLARADGYRLQAVPDLEKETLRALDILIIVNPLHSSNVGNWRKPVPSAFTESEIDRVGKWVLDGGKLWVIADHMPYGGAAAALAKRFEFTYENGFVISSSQRWPPERYTKQEGTLFENILTRDVDTLAGFTGSALQSPEGAIVAGKFPGTHQLLLPEVAWQFNQQTEVKPLDDYVLGAVRTHGKGKVAFFTEAAMFTAQLVRDTFQVGFNSPLAPHNQQFALNVLHWLDDELPAAIVERLLAGQAQAFESNDPDAVAAFYARDGIIYEPTGKEIKSREAIAGYWQRLAGRAVSWETEILEAEMIGDQILAVCRFDIRFKNPDGQTVVAKSKAMLTFKTEAGEYKIHRDFYTPLRE